MQKTHLRDATVLSRESASTHVQLGQHKFEHVGKATTCFV